MTPLKANRVINGVAGRERQRRLGGHIAGLESRVAQVACQSVQAEPAKGCSRDEARGNAHRPALFERVVEEPFPHYGLWLWISFSRHLLRLRRPGSRTWATPRSAFEITV